MRSTILFFTTFYILVTYIDDMVPHDFFAVYKVIHNVEIFLTISLQIIDRIRFSITYGLTKELSSRMKLGGNGSDFSSSIELWNDNVSSLILNLEWNFRKIAALMYIVL